MDPTAAPVELTIDGKTYKAYPLRDVDHEEFNKWVRRKYLECCQESIEDNKELMAVALSEIQTMNWMVEPGQIIAFTVAGMQKLANLLCRRNDIPMAPFKDVEAQREIMRAFGELHGSTQGPSSDSGEPLGN